MPVFMIGLAIMHLKLKHILYEAIHKAIESSSKDDLWYGYTHDNLYMQMTDAAALVFDSSIDGQKHYQRESIIINRGNV